MNRKHVLKFAVVVAMGASVLAWGGRSLFPRRARDGHAGVELHVPHVTEPIPINAEMEGKTAWATDAGSTANLKDAAGKGMVPYTEARVRWGNGNLYFWLYAGDLDLEGKVRDPDADLTNDDAFRVEIGAGERVHVIDVSVLGTLSDAVCAGRSRAPRDQGRGKCDSSWQSHAVVAVDADGTLDRIHDNDEEWLVEMAIPLDALELGGAGPGTRIPFSVSRCEVGYDGVHACGSFGLGEPAGELVLGP